MYEGILTAVKCYQRRLDLDVKENFVTGGTFVWRCLYKSSVEDIYSCLVKTSETPKSKVLAVEIDTFGLRYIFRTTLKKCLILIHAVFDTFSGLHLRNVSYGSSTNCYIICYSLAGSYFSDSL